MRLLKTRSFAALISAGIAAYPAGAKQTLFDYPPDAVARGEQGLVVLSFDLSPAGVVSNCYALQSSGSPSLDSYACAVLTDRIADFDAFSVPPTRPLSASARILFVLPGKPLVTIAKQRPHLILAYDPSMEEAIRLYGKGGRLHPVEKISPESWIGAKDYPKQLRYAGEAGSVSALLSVTPQGKVSGCDIVISSGYPRLDAQTCAVLLRKARFRPATDARGKPIASVSVSSITWGLAYQ